MNLTEKAHEIIASFIRYNDAFYAIDASCGNGHDTLFLAKHLGQNSQIFAFDIQEAAVKNTSALLQKNSLNAGVQIFNASHSEMQKYIPLSAHKKIDIAMFNLGWLPLSDKTIITKKETTLKALESLKFLMKPFNNLVSVLSYRGHEGGAEEFEGVKEFVSQYNPQIFGDVSNAKSPILFIFSIA